MTINQNHELGKQVDALSAIMLKELKRPMNRCLAVTPYDILTLATNLVTDHNVRVMEAPVGLAPSTEVQTAVKAEDMIRCEICSVHKMNHRRSTHPFLPPKAEEPRPFTRAAYDAVEASRQPKITKDMLENAGSPSIVHQHMADNVAEYKRKLGETPAGYTHTDAYAFSRARKAELEAEKGRLITVRELTNQDMGKHIVVTLTDSHTVAGTLTRIDYLTQTVHRLHLSGVTWSKVPEDAGIRTLRVNTDRPVRVSDR